jgi:hypothetical protein
MFLLFGHLPLSLAAPLDDLVAAAKKEGEIELLAPSTTGQKGAQALGNAFNKKYGLTIKMNYTPSSNMTGDVAKLVMGAASRATPEWDLMLVTDAHHATLWGRKLHQPFDYVKLGVAPELIQYDNGVVNLASFCRKTAKKLHDAIWASRWEMILSLLSRKWVAKESGGVR